MSFADRCSNVSCYLGLRACTGQQHLKETGVKLGATYFMLGLTSLLRLSLSNRFRSEA